MNDYLMYAYIDEQDGRVVMSHEPVLYAHGVKVVVNPYGVFRSGELSLGFEVKPFDSRHGTEVDQQMMDLLAAALRILVRHVLSGTTVGYPFVWEQEG